MATTYPNWSQYFQATAGFLQGKGLMQQHATVNPFFFFLQYHYISSQFIPFFLQPHYFFLYGCNALSQLMLHFL